MFLECWDKHSGSCVKKTAECPFMEFDEEHDDGKRLCAGNEEYTCCSSVNNTFLTHDKDRYRGKRLFKVEDFYL